jgi:hypothetical protein
VPSSGAVHAIHARIALLLSQFPKTFELIRQLEAVGRQDDDLHWQLGLVICEECGAPGVPGVNNGSLARMQKLAKALERAGYKHYSLIRLRKLRDTAHALADIRISGVPWSFHEVARDLDTLRDAQAQAKQDGVNFTRDFIIKFRKRRRRERAAKERAAHSKLKGKAAIDLAREAAKVQFLTGLNDATEMIDAGLRAIDRQVYGAADRAEMMEAWNRFERHIISANPHLDVPIREAAE